MSRNLFAVLQRVIEARLQLLQYTDCDLLPVCLLLYTIYMGDNIDSNDSCSAVSGLSFNVLYKIHVLLECASDIASHLAFLVLCNCD